MADQRSMEMFAFNFARRTFAYKRLAQGLNRSVSAFSSLMCEYLDAVVKADQGAQYVDDIGIAANNATNFTRNVGQSSSAFSKQDWSWKMRKTTSESENLNSFEEDFHQKESHHKPWKIKTSQRNLDSPSTERR